MATKHIEPTEDQTATMDESNYVGMTERDLLKDVLYILYMVCRGL